MSATCYLTEPKPLTINLLTKYTDVLYWFLTFALQTRTAFPPSSESSQPVYLPRLTNSFEITFFADPHPLTPIESYSFKSSGGEGDQPQAVALVPPTEMPSLSFHSLTGVHFATLLFSDSCRSGGGGHPSYSPTAPGDPNFRSLVFNSRLLPSPPRGPLLPTTSHQSPVTSHQP
jgi:hypothetical protein